MIRKTVLLTGIAGLMFTAAPALAQDAAPAPAPAEAPAQPGTLQLQPGSDVKGSDGAVLGKLEGVRSNDAGQQELTVRGPDGQLRGVPLAGLKPEGSGVSVGWTSAEFTAAPAIPGSATDAAASGQPASDTTAAAASPESAAPETTTPEPTPDAPAVPESQPQAN
jgi:hypothetical protein